MKHIYIILFISILNFSLSQAQIKIVPINFASIQQAVSASNNGDTILVKEGIYNENIILNGKNVVLCSDFFFTNDTSKITHTIIDGGQNTSVLNIKNNIDTSTLISGFTIRNGSGLKIYVEDHGYIFDTNYLGGGIYLGDSCNPKLQDLIITNNTATHGGGIFIQGSPILSNLKIVNNIAIEQGGGINCPFTTNGLNITNSIISNNTALRGGGIDYMGGFYGKRLLLKKTELCNNISTYTGQYSYEGGAALNGGNSQIILENVTMVNNKGKYSFSLANYYLVIRNSIIWNNKIYIDSQHGNIIPTSIEFSDIENGLNNFEISGYDTLIWGNGNISDYPNFVDSALMNYNLSANSPCINTGNPDPLFNDSDGSRNDIGAHEYVLPSSIEINTDNPSFNIYQNAENLLITENKFEIYKIEIYNCIGNKVICKRNSNQINISNLRHGLYIILVETNKGSFVKKIIK